MEHRGTSRFSQFRRGGQAVLIVLLLTGLAVGAAQAQASGGCVRAEVPWRMIMPDGTDHAPGTVEVCHNRDYTPVSGLHALKVDGSSLGMFTSYVVQSESLESRHPILVFHTTADGAAQLVAYGWPDRGVMKIFWLHDLAMDKRVLTARARSVGQSQLEEEYYVVAAEGTVR
jgi:hypothetical protein